MSLRDAEVAIALLSQKSQLLKLGSPAEVRSNSMKMGC